MDEEEKGKRSIRPRGPQDFLHAEPLLPKPRILREEATELLREVLARIKKLYKQKWSVLRLWTVGSYARSEDTVGELDLLLETRGISQERERHLLRELGAAHPHIRIYSLRFPPRWSNRDPSLSMEKDKRLVWQSPKLRRATKASRRKTRGS